MIQPSVYRFWVLGFLVILISLEIVWSWRKDKKVYQLKETITNLGIMAGFQLSKFLFAGVQLSVLGWIYRFRIFEIPQNTIVFITAFFLVDFVYYWFHRASHEWKPLWAFHLIHHSSLWMNLTTSYRLNWFSALVAPWFYVPLVLIGFSPEFIVISITVNLLYQFFMHTEAVGKLGPLEGVIDTPSAHRVHHGSNPEYIDKNFGGVLMIWDRLFGTYQPETTKVHYGITTGFVSSNPVVLVLHGFIDLFRGKMKYKG